MRPISFVGTHERIQALIHTVQYLFNLGGGFYLDKKEARIKIITQSEIDEQNRKRQQEIKLLLTHVDVVNISCSQILFMLVEEVASLTTCLGNASIRALVSTNHVHNEQEELMVEAESIQATINMDSITLSTKLMERYVNTLL